MSSEKDEFSPIIVVSIVKLKEVNGGDVFLAVDVVNEVLVEVFISGSV